MGLFKNKIPTAKKATEVGNKILNLSQELKSIIELQDCVDFEKVNITGLEYALFMYDLEFYKQVMTIKYSNFYIETIIRTIFINFEENIRKSGNNIQKDYMLNIYLKLSDSINKIYNIAKNQGVDEFVAVAMYLCSDECLMTEYEIEINENMIVKIAEHFRKIINLPETEI